MARGNGPNDDSKATEVTLDAVADAVEALVAALPAGGAATEAKQDDAIALLTTIDADTSALAAVDFATQTTSAAILAKIIAAPATEAKQDDAITALGLVATEVTLAGVEAKVSATNGILAALRNNQDDAADARKWAKSTVSWTTDDGTAEIELALAEGEYWVHAQAHENAVGAGAATYTLHADTTTGFTPDASKTEFYTSDADIALPAGVFEANLSPVPISVGVAGKVYLRVIPDVGGGNTTTGSFDLFTTPNQ